MDDIRIKPIVQPGADWPASSGLTGAAQPTGGFLTSLKEAIEKTNQIQIEASEAVQKFVTGESQNVHQAMIALQKADVSFQLMMQLRNKIVMAYEEIQRMQI